MKTLILSFLFIIGLASPNICKPINDIYSIKEPILADEAYVNDIPFSTYDIAVDAILEGDEAKLEDEVYVDDIPFDTRAIAGKYLLRRMIETTGEAEVNDIPFSTGKILNEQLAALLTEQYRNEKNTCDLPEGPNYIICSYENGVPSCVAVKIKRPKKATPRQRKFEDSDYTIIFPVKADIPKPEINIEHRELLVVPGSSL